MKTTMALEEQLLSQFEAILIPLVYVLIGVKVFMLSPSYIQAMCPRLDDF